MCFSLFVHVFLRRASPGGGSRGPPGGRKNYANGHPPGHQNEFSVLSLITVLNKIVEDGERTLRKIGWRLGGVPATKTDDDERRQMMTSGDERRRRTTTTDDERRRRRRRTDDDGRTTVETTGRGTDDGRRPKKHYDDQKGKGFFN